MWGRVGEPWVVGIRHLHTLWQCDRIHYCHNKAIAHLIISMVEDATPSAENTKSDFSPRKTHKKTTFRVRPKERGFANQCGVQSQFQKVNFLQAFMNTRGEGTGKALLHLWRCRSRRTTMFASDI